EMRSGTNIELSITQGIIESNCFVAFVTKEYVQRPWCVFEMNCAIEHKKLILCVVLEELPPVMTLVPPLNELLLKYLYIDMSDSKIFSDYEKLSQKCHDIVISSLRLIAEHNLTQLNQSHLNPSNLPDNLSVCMETIN